MAYSSRLRWLSALALLALSGCDDDGEGAPQTIDEMMGRFTEMVCELEVACELTPDMATCLLTQRIDESELAALKGAIAAGRINYEAAKADACLDSLEPYYAPSNCTQSSRAGLETSISDACQSVLIGTVTAGGACLIDAECADDGICEQTDLTCNQQCCPGTCVARPAPVPVGGSCATLQPNQSCAFGSYCSPTATGGAAVCTAPSAVEGSACTTIFGCASPLFCDLDPAIGAGTCRRAATSGAPCSIAGYSYMACDDIRETCNRAIGTCVRRTAVGEPCEANRADCVGYAICVGTTCVAHPKPGEACTLNAAPICRGIYRCSTETNTCEVPPSDGSCG